MKIAYIAHPISGDVEGNIKKVLQIVREVCINESNVMPYAAYIVDCMALDDSIPEERTRGIKNDIAIFKKKGFLDEVRLYGNRISYGMKCEIELARSEGIPIIAMTEETKLDLGSL